MSGGTVERWTPEETTWLIEGFKRVGPDWASLQTLIPHRKGIASRWKRLIAASAFID